MSEIPVQTASSPEEWDELRDQMAKDRELYICTLEYDIVSLLFGTARRTHLDVDMIQEAMDKAIVYWNTWKDL